MVDKGNLSVLDHSLNSILNRTNCNVVRWFLVVSNGEGSPDDETMVTVEINVSKY